MLHKARIKSIDARMEKCNDHHIFKECSKEWEGEKVKKMSMFDAADYIVKHEFDKSFWKSELEADGVEEDDVSRAFVKACHDYRRNLGGPRPVLHTWNIAMKSNGESHGTIFTGLYKNKEYRLLEELMDEIDNDFDFDT